MTDYTLLREHTHDGRQLLAGARVTLTPQQAAWLDGLGVISLDGTSKPRAPRPALFSPKPLRGADISPKPKRWCCG